MLNCTIYVTYKLYFDIFHFNTLSLSQYIGVKACEKESLSLSLSLYIYIY